jgi:aryl-alcohol dehydrogenase-like predicted oxidoreductase
MLMELRKLGRTDIDVTSVCLDTAEMYPVPGEAATQGRTESYIGSWIAERKNRDKYILASKVTGRSGMVWCRDEASMTRQTPAQIDEAVEKSLKRLQTDYIDLYQLHWPDRALPAFGFHSYQDYDPSDMAPLEDILGALSRHIEKGNIRHVGLSNELSWGTMKFLELAEKSGGPRMVSIPLSRGALIMSAPKSRCASRSGYWPIRRWRWAC